MSIQPTKQSRGERARAWHHRPSLVVDAGVGEVDVALVVEVEVVGEVEAHALGLRCERRGQPALGADLEQAKVGVGDVQVPGLLIEAEPERSAADVLVGEVLQRRGLGPAAELLRPARGGRREGDPPLTYRELSTIFLHDKATTIRDAIPPFETIRRFNF